MCEDSFTRSANRLKLERAQVMTLGATANEQVRVSDRQVADRDRGVHEESAVRRTFTGRDEANAPMRPNSSSLLASM